MTHPGHPVNREEISLTCPFRTCQRRKHGVCVCVCVCKHPEGLKLVAWGQTPQVEMAAIREYRAATGGLVTKHIGSHYSRSELRYKHVLKPA